LCIISIVKPARSILTVILCAALLLAASGTVRALQEGGRYFPETGHNMTGEFWAYYQSVPDASLVFGFPITEAFVTNFPTGVTVQYFQRARLELRPDLPAGQRVQLTALGSLLYKPGAPAANYFVPGACRTFATGYSVCYEFLAFFDAHGGLERFGNPISAFEFQDDGRILQHFERARLEWHPEQPRGQNILLADLGGIYFYKVGEDPVRITKVAPFNGIIEPQTVLGLRTLAFVAKAVTGPNDTQKVYVVVQDQTFSPVSGATGTVTVDLPNSPDLVYPVTTDANGIAIVTGIPLQGLPPGSLIPVTVKMTFGGKTTSATTSFRVWR
jgi:hypothetical protein